MDAVVQWKMKFNVDKCKVLSITRSNNKINFSYKMGQHVLERVDSMTDLGVKVTALLSFKEHVACTAAKAHSVLGIIKRSLGFDAPSNVKRLLYITNVRSILEYCSLVWSPYQFKYISQIEKVQRYATKYIVNYADLSYKERCLKLNLLPLCYRREILDLCFLFKCIQKGDTSLFHNYFTKIQNNRSNLRSSSKGLLFSKSMTKSLSFHSLFFNRVVRLWNVLPLSIRNEQSMNSFKRQLKEFYRDKLTSHFDVDSHCTWSICCGCSSCRQVSKSL